MQQQGAPILPAQGKQGTQGNRLARNKELVLAATADILWGRDPDAVDRWVAPAFRQHSPLAAGSRDGLRRHVADLPEEFSCQVVRIIADRDLVVLHVVCDHGGRPMVGFHILRIDEGKVAEHWDAMTPLVSGARSRLSQVDGPAEVRHPDRTETSRALVAEFAKRVLIGGEWPALADYISTQNYLQHNPEVADGLHGTATAVARWAAAGRPLAYHAVHEIIAEGEFVLTQAAGTFGAPVACYDLWRVGDEQKIVEHWDAIADIPPPCPTTTAPSKGLRIGALVLGRETGEAS